MQRQHRIITFVLFTKDMQSATSLLLNLKSKIQIQPNKSSLCPREQDEFTVLHPLEPDWAEKIHMLQRFYTHGKVFAYEAGMWSLR